MSTGCFIHTNSTKRIEEQKTYIWNKFEKKKTKLIYHCPNGNGLLSAIDVVEFRLTFVRFKLLSSNSFSTGDLINERTRRGFRFCT